MKKIWIISDSEPIPELTNSGRLMRAGKFCDYAKKNGFDVTWWSSTWMHYEKRFISDSKFETTLQNGTSLKLLHVKKAYKKHVSVDRILYNRRLGKKFFKEINKISEKPDVIVCSWPLIELSYAAVKYGKKNNIPVILDIRDLWPEIFTQPFSGIKKLIVKLAVSLLYSRKVKYAVKNAYQIIGVTNDAVNLGYRWGRKKKDIDHTLFLSSVDKKFPKDILDDCEKKWNEIGVSKNDKIVVYVGSINLRITRLEIVLGAAKNCLDIKFVFCGTGLDYEKLRVESQNEKNVFFTGYMNEAEIAMIEEWAICGLVPYSNTPDFVNSLPTKFGEYLSKSLPVLTCLKGDARKMLEKNDCGDYFSNSDDLEKLIDKYLDKSFLIKKKENAKRLFNKSFNADVTYNNFMNSLKKL